MFFIFNNHGTKVSTIIIYNIKNLNTTIELKKAINERQMLQLLDIDKI